MSFFPLWIAYHHQAFLNDDSYITLTYAKSIAAGSGFVFNQPPATLGTTTPLFTLAVAGLSMFLPSVEISRIAIALTASCWAGAAWLIYIVRQSLGLSDWQAITVGSIVIASGWVGFLGMEAYLFAFLLILTMVFYLRNWWLLTGLATGLLFLTRGEGILLLPVLVVFHLGEGWRQEGRLSLRVDSSMLRIVVGCSLVILIWFSYAWITFGRVLPNTLSAKVAQSAAGHWRSFPSRLLSEWLPSWGRELTWTGCPTLNLWWFLAIGGLWYVLLSKRQWVILLLWVTCYILGYSILNVAGYWWYQLPILFVLQILVGLGLCAVQEGLARLKPKWGRVGQIISVALVAVVVAMLARPRVNAIQQGTSDPRASSYLELTEWINENTSPFQSVAYVEIGYLGYHTDNRVIDLMGLVTPDITPYIAEGDFSRGFWAHEPDFFVYLPDFDWALGEIREDPRFEQAYRAVTTLPGPREADFVIYTRINPYE